MERQGGAAVDTDAVGSVGDTIDDAGTGQQLARPGSSPRLHAAQRRAVDDAAGRARADRHPAAHHRSHRRRAHLRRAAARQRAARRGAASVVAASRSIIRTASATARARIRSSSLARERRWARRTEALILRASGVERASC